jgi:transposase InsO family protein
MDWCIIRIGACNTPAKPTGSGWPPPAWCPAGAAGATATITPPWKASGAASNANWCIAVSCATRSQARAAIFEWIEIFYYRERFHSALGYQSLVDFETNLK